MFQLKHLRNTEDKMQTSVQTQLLEWALTIYSCSVFKGKLDVALVYYINWDLNLHLRKGTIITVTSKNANVFLKIFPEKKREWNGRTVGMIQDQMQLLVKLLVKFLSFWLTKYSLASLPRNMIVQNVP